MSLVLSLILSEVFEFPLEHPSHHVPLNVSDVLSLELHHHLLDLPVCDQLHQWILALHQSDRVEIVVVRVGGGGTRLNKVVSLESEEHAMLLCQHGLRKHLELPHGLYNLDNVQLLPKFVLSLLEEEMFLESRFPPLVVHRSETQTSHHVLSSVC